MPGRRLQLKHPQIDGIRQHARAGEGPGSGTSPGSAFFLSTHSPPSSVTVHRCQAKLSRPTSLKLVAPLRLVSVPYACVVSPSRNKRLQNIFKHKSKTIGPRALGAVCCKIPLGSSFCARADSPVRTRGGDWDLDDVYWSALLDLVQSSPH